MPGLSRNGPRRGSLLLGFLLSSPLLHGCASPNLRSAIQQGDLIQVRQVLQSGADVNKSYRDGWTPLLYATRAGHVNIVEALLQSGADVQARNRHGWSAILIASRYGYPGIVRLLIDHGGYVHTHNHAGYTPLMLAAWGGHTEVIQVLSSAGVRLDVRNDEGKTAVYYAARNARTDIVRYLLNEGATVELHDDGADDLFATAVALKTRAAMHEEGGQVEAAGRDYRSAADYFGRAEPLLVRSAESYRNRQAAGALLSLLGLVASMADLNNVRQGNPTRYYDLVPQVSPGQTDALRVMEAYYREIAQYSAEQGAACRQRAEELGRGGTGQDGGV